MSNPPSPGAEHPHPANTRKLLILRPEEIENHRRLRTAMKKVQPLTDQILTLIDTRASILEIPSPSADLRELLIYTMSNTERLNNRPPPPPREHRPDPHQQLFVDEVRRVSDRMLQHANAEWIINTEEKIRLEAENHRLRQWYRPNIAAWHPRNRKAIYHGALLLYVLEVMVLLILYLVEKATGWSIFWTAREMCFF
ncbi:MAG: hypothetical protein L6R35_005401 [Caloplaca aegaea]|nr:MAG: hypothetical protein L6R35_005401 [Caloplaca aegaea]